VLEVVNKIVLTDCITVINRQLQCTFCPKTVAGLLCNICHLLQVSVPVRRKGLFLYWTLFEKKFACQPSHNPTAHFKHSLKSHFSVFLTPLNKQQC